MSAKPIFLLLLHLYAWLGTSLGQRSGYSLQAAVDELHRREAAKYPLNAPPATQQRFGGGAFLGGSPQEQDYWDEDADGSNGNNNGNNNRNRHRLNKILAKYLERENYDADHGGLSLGPFGGYEFDEDNNNLFLNYPDEKKRASYFRERDNKWASGDNTAPSIFRERETPNPNGGDHAELTDQFLREIEESQELEREARYKDALRRLWEKYQQQENELDGSLHEEYKRMISTSPNYYMGPLMQKKRSYPVLPWLPYSSRKKRVPAMQPSVKRSPNENENFGKTDEKVAWELSELFGGPAGEEKKKRSTDEQLNVATTNTPEKSTTSTTMKTHMRLEGAPTDKENETKTVADAEHEHQEHAGHEGHKHAKTQTQNQSEASHQQRKRSYHHAHGDSHEDCDESEEHDEHEHEHEHDEHEEEEEEEEHELEDIDEDEEEERKKKRDVTTAAVGSAKRRSNWEVIKEDQIVPEDLEGNLRRKKSVNWSKYFGLDRKKKYSIRDEDILKKKRSTNEEDNGSEEKQQKRDFDPDKLDNMDKKLQAIEDLIIDDTIKYTGAHEGIANPEEIRRLKDHVLSRLATAYSLEKMRRALDKLRQSVDNENHFLRNVIENESKSEENEALEQQKRLSVKKEKVQFDNQHLGLTPSIEKSKELHSNAMPSSNGNGAHNNHSDNPDNDEEDMKKKKKKRNNSYLRYPELPNDFVDFEPELGAGHYETFNDAYLGNKNYMIGSNQCPLIESMAERCRNVDLLSGDIHQELLPICGVHQICYLCGTSQVACDYQYLAEADAICGHSNDCQAAARSVLMILRGTPGPQLGPKECLKNSCLYSAMREIGL